MASLGQTIENARFWRDTAGQLRQVAEHRNDGISRRFLLLAAEYERLADQMVVDRVRLIPTQRI